jgi:hypothetical protein
VFFSGGLKKANVFIVFEIENVSNNNNEKKKKKSKKKNQTKNRKQIKSYIFFQKETNLEITGEPGCDSESLLLSLDS